MRPAGLLVLPVLLWGCAARRSAPPPFTAQEIQKRTGFATRASALRGEQIALPPGLRLDQPLTSDAAAAIALWNNPQLQADLAALGIAEADRVEAALLRNPRLDLLVPVGAKPLELLLNLPVDAFWQRPRRIDAAEKAYQQLATALIQNGLNTVRDARIAHADAVHASKREAVARQSAALRERIAAITEARLRAGDISELDTMAARVDAKQAGEALVRQRHESGLALERLRAAIGLVAGRPSLQVEEEPVSTIPPPATEAFIEKALKLRPDLRAAELAIAAAASRARWERSRLFALSAQLSSKEVGTSGLLTGPGAGIDLPVFHRNQGLISRADAEVEVASLQYLALKQRIAFEVADARGRLVQAQQALARVREDVLPPLRRSVELAQDQYEKGDVAYLLVLEQTRGTTDAQFRVAELEAAIRTANAHLERSVGAR